MSVNVGLRRDRRSAPPSPGRMARARGILSTILLIAVSAFALLTVVVPTVLGAQTYTVLTGSMNPGMPPGSLIAVRPTPFDAVRVGDVVTYQIRSGEPAVVTHRVVGTTSSTSGDRLLITRGDANDLDDPPVQREQLRGTVVLALPLLGYPSAVFGGQERGAAIAVVGVAVIAWGAVMFALDLRRPRRRSRTPMVVVAAILAASCSVAVPAPARADTVGSSPARLLVSDDGEHFVADGSIRLFAPDGPLVPGASSVATLWIRNGSADPARAGLRLETTDDGDPASRALADALRLVVASVPVPPGGAWVSEIIPAGRTVRLDMALRLDAEAQNDSRRGRATVTPVVQLTEAIADAVLPGRPTSAELPRTGAPAAPVGLVIVATAALIAGAAAGRRRGAEGR
ncbi:signal peptidase I [Microbacterium sp. NPDC089190]|uniref:signal peptidase I n=1 Tax=Microbacterium sp. NPDC089190 TaxID=3155063 RepID=UPI00344C7F3E